MTAIKTILVTLLAGVLSIGIAVLGERWLGGGEPRRSLQSSGDGPIDYLPVCEIPDLDGQAIDSADWSEKLVVMHYWATWCPSCVAQLPLLGEAYRRHAEDPVQFVGIALDRPAELARFLTDWSIDYPVGIGDAQAMALTRRLGNRLQGIPFLVIFNRSGERIFQRTGSFTATELSRQIERGLAGETRTERMAGR